MGTVQRDVHGVPETRKNRALSALHMLATDTPLIYKQACDYCGNKKVLLIMCDYLDVSNLHDFS